MPLLILCGPPKSGKSTLAREMKAYLVKQYAVEVCIIQDRLPTPQAYQDSNTEKMSRGALKASVEQNLYGARIVIVDSLNHIKGFRYELYCIAKSHSTQHLCVYCDLPMSQRLRWNQQNAEQPCLNQHQHCWEPIMLQDMTGRFEVPNDRNRWDKPLFHITSMDCIPFQEIAHALLNGKALKPGLATQSKNIGQANFLYELNRITLAIQEALLSGDDHLMSVDGVTHTVLSEDSIPPMKIKRLRRQFVSIAASNPPRVASIGNVFVDYINDALGAV